jgi:3-oxoacyl-[acyl-carrier protein] reductase
MQPDLSGRIALVTGASRGIGAAIAMALAGAGAAVAINYRERGADAMAVGQAIRRAGGQAVEVGADVSHRDAVISMVKNVSVKLGLIDVLVNNAGIGVPRGIEDLTEADFDQVIAVNLKSAFLCTQAGIEGLTRGYAARLAAEGITVNAVAPSLIETDMTRARRNEWASRIPVARMGHPEEVAQAVLMVIGNSYMTGQTIQLNGGMAFV